MWRLIGVLSLLLLTVVPTTSRAQIGSIEADMVELDANFATAAANGDAVLTYGRVSLHADAITANRATGDVVALGHLTLRQDGRQLRGDHLQYNFRTDEGVLTDARVVEQGLIIRGELMEFSPRTLVAHRASFTTCTKEPPDYALNADAITLTAAGQDPRGRPVHGRLTFDRARVYYRGRRLLTLPGYSLPVGQIDRRGATPFPTLGYARADGPYGRLDYALGRPERALTAEVDVRLTAYRGVRGLIGLRNSRADYDLFADYTHLEDVRETELQENRFTFSTADVLVSRAPELGASIADLPLGRGLRFRGDLGYGSYTEFDEESGDELERANRLTISALIDADTRPLSPSVAITGAAGLRLSTYSSDDSLRIGFLRGTVTYTRSEDNRLALSFIYRPTSGRTPFLFDRVEVDRELLADLRYRISPVWRLRAVEAYDLDAGRTRDLSLSLTRTAHCLEYTLGWKQLTRNVFFGIGLAPIAPSAASVSDEHP